MKYKLFTILTLLCLTNNAQQIPDPSDASAEAILKSSKELLTKLKEYKIELNEVKFKFNGAIHRYSTQCEYIKNTLPQDYYVIGFLGSCPKNNNHPAYEIKTEVHYRRSNSANSCKLDNSWKHCATEIWSPTANEAVKASNENLPLLISFLKQTKEPFLFRIEDKFNDIVNVTNFKILDKIEWNGTLHKTEMLSATSKLNLAKCEIIMAAFNNEKTAITELKKVQILVKFVTENANGSTKVKSYDNLPLGSAEGYKEQIIFKANDSKREYDSLFAGYKTVGFEKIYNTKSILVKPVSEADSEVPAREAFFSLLKDVLSDGKKLNNPERLKEHLRVYKDDKRYDDFVAFFGRMENDGYGWGNLRFVDNNTLKYDYFGRKLLNKSTKGDRNISITQSYFEGKHKFTISVQ